MCMHTYIYIYIYRERERLIYTYAHRQTHKQTDIYAPLLAKAPLLITPSETTFRIFIYIYIKIYIYIYM